MLHDSPLSSTLWKKLFKSLNCLNSKYAIVYIISHTFIIFIVGAIVDLIRQIIEKLTIDKILNSKKFRIFANKIKKVLNKIYNVI